MKTCSDNHKLAFFFFDIFCDHDPELVPQTRASKIAVKDFHSQTAYPQVLCSTTLVHTDGQIEEEQLYLHKAE